MELEGSLPCTQQPATGLYLEPDDPVHTFPFYFPKIHSDITLPSTPRSYEWCLPFRLSNNIFYAFHISLHTCYMLRLYLLP
jgi:hypothetical protein